MDDPIIEVIGKTGKPKKIHLSDMDLNEKVVHDKVTGKFIPYISRWYRLPGEYNTPQEAGRVLLDFIKKYYT